MWPICNVQAAPTPAVTLQELDRLVVLYKSLSLPLPPKGARLVEFEHSEGTDNGRPVSQGRAGYFVSQDDPYHAKLFLGTSLIQRGYGPWDRSLPPPFPVPQTVPRLDLGPIYELPFPEDSGLALAVTERVRGHSAFALELLREAKSKTIYPPRPDFPAMRSIGPEERMRTMALNHWFNAAVDPNSDRKEVLRQLTYLLKRYPDLKCKASDEALSGLRAFTQSGHRSNDPVELAIDDLCRCREDGTALDDPDPWRSPRFKPLLKLVEMGYEAMPRIVAHLDDPRLSGAVDQRNTAMLSFLTVGDVCTNLSLQFANIDRDELGQIRAKEVVRNWWKAASRVGERENCLQELSASKNNLPEAQIRLAERKYPDLLLQVYRQILAERPATNTYTLLAAMRRSALDRKRIVDAAVVGAASENLGQVNSALWTIERLDKPRFEKLVVAILNVSPKTIGRRQPAEQAFIAQGAACSESPEVWAALTAATKRADTDLRLDFMQETTSVDHSKKGRKLFLKYLLGFFDNYGDPAASEPDFATDEVQNQAAKFAAEELGIRGIPHMFAGRAVWEPFRDMLRKKIAVEIQ